MRFALAGRTVRDHVYEALGRGVAFTECVHQAQAAHNDGADSAFLKRVATMRAANGGRDLISYAIKDLGLNTLIEVYDVPVYLKGMGSKQKGVKRRGNKGGIVKTTWPVLFPHEIFGALQRLSETKFHNMFGSSQRWGHFWARVLEQEPAWLANHNSPNLILSEEFPCERLAPLRVFGDDTGKKYMVHCLHYCGELKSKVPSKIPIYVLPMKVALKDLSENALQTVSQAIVCTNVR